MPRLTTHAARLAAVALCSLLTAKVAHAATLYYPAWEQLYDDTDSTRAQTPSAMALDSHGNTFVTGAETVGNGTGMYVAKYDSLDGHILWTRRISSGTVIYQMNAIAVDSVGDVVVTGSRNNGNIDFYTLKLKGIDGTNFWAAGAKVFNGANGGDDTAFKVVCDHADNVIVTGRSVGQNGMGNSTGYDWVTIKYDKDDAVAQIVANYSQTTTNLDDTPTGLAVDSSNNIYVTGTVQTALGVNRFYLRKLKAADLTKLWDIVPINTGVGTDDAEGGGTAVTIDSTNSVIATSRARDAFDHFGYFTIKFTSAGSEVWRTVGPFSDDTFGTPYSGSPAPRTSRAQPIGVAVGNDNQPIVTGTLLDASGNAFIRTAKYTSGGFFNNGLEFWNTPSIDHGLGFGDTIARAIAVDDAGNAIVLGETQNADGNTDVYLAKYDTLTGARVYFSTFSRSDTNPSQDKGVDVAIDRLGDIATLGTFIASKDGSANAGNNEFGTIKLKRLIAPTGDDLPDAITGVPDNAKVSVAGAPAISSAGLLATKLTFKSGSKVGNALLLEGVASGGELLPAIKGQPAPVGSGEPAVNWVSFSDPVVGPNGHYAFAAKVSGPAAKANGVWGNFGNGLIEVMRQGSSVAGLSDKLASVTNIGLSSNSLIALVKLTGPATTNTAVIRADNGNSQALMLRTGQTGFMINGVDHTIKGITLFSPAASEAGDGRWQGAAGIVARVSAVKTSDPKSKATAIVSIANGNSQSVYFYTGQAAAAPIASATYSGFGFPSTATGTQRFTFKATLTPRPKASNSALIFSSTGAAFNAYAQKGVATGVAGLPSGVTYGDFTDPIINTNSLVAFIATLKGSATDVKPTTNKAIVFGSPTSIFISVARTGDAAPDSAGTPTTAKWTAFTTLVLPGGTNSGPIFIGKLNTSKNNIGLWGRDSRGSVRQLLRQGDHLGDQVVKKFTVLNTVSKAMAAARSFDSAGSVAVAIVFADGKTAIQRIGIP